MFLEMDAVGLEVAACRADEHGTQAQQPQSVADVRGHSPAADFEPVGKEGQRDPFQPFGQELVGEDPGEGEQVVGGDRTGYSCSHGAVPLFRQFRQPAAVRSRWARSVRSQVKSSSSRPKWP
ncbi:hypothetical protein GCM10023079_52470 [Streptomyces chitinivorans]